MPFEVKGEMPQWRVLFEFLRTLGVGDIVSDEQLADLLPDAPEGSVRSAYFRARRELQDECRRSMDRVRGKGYRIVEAREHADLAKRQHKRARNRLKAAIAEVHSADRSRLTHEERRRMDEMEIHLARQADNIKRLEAKQSATEQRVAMAEKDNAIVHDRIDRLRDQLRRQGIELEDDPVQEPLPPVDED